MEDLLTVRDVYERFNRKGIPMGVLNNLEDSSWKGCSNDETIC